MGVAALAEVLRAARPGEQRPEEQPPAARRAAPRRAQEARLVHQMRAPQAQVPLAMAEAFRSGRLGVMDYYRMENIQSDTQMRGSIAHPEGKK